MVASRTKSRRISNRILYCKAGGILRIGVGRELEGMIVASVGGSDVVRMGTWQTVAVVFST